MSGNTGRFDSMKDQGEIVISVRGVSKCFEMYAKPIHRLFQLLFARRKKFFREFWALQDIDFNVRRGECVGIIGRNGAGKSTLLQIVTGTLQPTFGTVEIRGRVAALLELGSGFNPEFSGRDNIYMNASILGLAKDEIDAKYEEIVGFADIGDFIDQPVKTYSSGMMVRLAFAVNAFVDPDVLIVDEALAVGDIGFQMRCMQRLRELIARGTTLLFVTHDLGLVSSFCSKVLFLQGGRQMAFSTDVVATINAFRESVRVAPVAAADDSRRNAEVSEYRFGTHDATIESCEVFESFEKPLDLSAIVAGRKYLVRVTMNAKRDISNVVLGMSFRNREGVDVWGENTVSIFGMGFRLKVGINTMVFETCFNANVGEYGITCGIADISVNPRIELDQRWPLRKITVVSEHPGQGVCYGPWNFVEQT